MPIIKTGSVLSKAESDMPLLALKKKKAETLTRKDLRKFLAVLWRENGGISNAGCCGWAFSAAVGALRVCSGAAAAFTIPAAADALPPASGWSLGRSFSYSKKYLLLIDPCMNSNCLIHISKLQLLQNKQILKNANKEQFVPGWTSCKTS